MTELEEVLSHYGIFGTERGINRGPLVTQIVFVPKAGTKLKNITAHLEDIARELKQKSLRVEAIENSTDLGFEIPNTEFATVDFKQILDTADFRSAKGELPICLGADITGKPLFADLAKMPHLLVAGTTGSGKSVGLNTFVLSLIARKTPSELKLVMIDPKRIEFTIYNDQKYLLYPVISDNGLAVAALKNLVDEMEHRFSVMQDNLVKNIDEYNAKASEVMPYIVCVIDEFADLMSSDKNIASYVQRLAQKARAAGIHLIMATQRPSVDVVTGVLKANFPSRLAYKTASGTDSRTILDTVGAENLIGRGDCLFLASDGNLKRAHGAYISDENIAAMLSPYRCKIKPMPAVSNELPPADTHPKDEKSVSTNVRKKSWFSDAWSTLTKAQKRRLFNWIVKIVKEIIKAYTKSR
ncbi:MAG: DNA translocase FtsK [Alphaproteobacteria bacterium]|nr:DNA translocase FtsK [Alphaproteobacteria bacterium]MBQ9235473.1 DNA translocase FtsK [Alphaproteobacteria bacterium]